VFQITVGSPAAQMKLVHHFLQIAEIALAACWRIDLWESLWWEIVSWNLDYEATLCIADTELWIAAVSKYCVKVTLWLGKLLSHYSISKIVPN